MVFIYLFIYFYLFSFLGMHPWHMEVCRLGIELELQLPAYTRATATRDPSRVCDLYHSSWQHHILNPLSKARGTCILMDTNWIHFLCTTIETRYALFLTISSIMFGDWIESPVLCSRTSLLIPSKCESLHQLPQTPSPSHPLPLLFGHHKSVLHVHEFVSVL